MENKATTPGQRIKLALKNSKTTQRALSKALGVSESSITYYVQDETEPSAVGWATIAKMTGVTLDWLITGDGPMRRSEAFQGTDTTGTNYPEVQGLTDEYVDKLVKEDLPKYCAQLGVNQVVAERIFRETLAEVRDLGKLPERDQFGDMRDLVDDALRREEKRTGRQRPVQEDEGTEL